jgi:hypothetical protein
MPRDRAKSLRKARARNPRLALEAHLWTAYRLSLKSYDELLMRQNGVCAVCERPPKKGQRLHVDHDHELGVVRALLCGLCNSALGLMQEDPDLLWKLHSYADHCGECREWFTRHPVRYAIAQAFKHDHARDARRKQLVAEAMQRLYGRSGGDGEPVEDFMRTYTGRKIAELLTDLGASHRANLPEIAPVRAGDAREAVYV